MPKAKSKKSPVLDYTIEEIAEFLGMSTYSIRNALWRYRRQELTEADYLSGLTSVPPAYRAGRSLRWPRDKFNKWKEARMTFDLMPLEQQREIRAQARERALPGSGARRKPGRKPGLLKGGKPRPAKLPAGNTVSDPGPIAGAA
ncbi:MULTISPECIES: helix-turn-helix domain-containing protein [unclassified Burkholderia]|uniref:helix-turn-helix domain-containing protein n=1 Tax=unclassified Burkholderia TaxID=2613784 RepID=UPI002AB2946F|nr:MULTISPECIES: helix-turn-helix domain-containing protein [unclassified Burkholderia]